MFKSARVACFLNNFAGHGDDLEHKEMKLTFHVSPINKELAAEVDPDLAESLYRLIDGEWAPNRVTGKCAFTVPIQMQNVRFFPLPEVGVIVKEDAFVPSVAISNLRAARMSPSPNAEFRLEFDAVIPMNSETMRLVEKYYKATTHLTMSPVQRTLGDPVVAVPDDDDSARRELQDALNSAAAGDEPTADGKSAIEIPAVWSAARGAGDERPRRPRKSRNTETVN